MLLNIIMWIGLYPVIFIMYFVLKLSAKDRSGIVFGVRLPKAADGEEEFAALLEERRKIYYRQMRMTFFVFLVIPLISFLVPYFSIQFTIWMFWMLVAILFLELPYIRANRELVKWKKERRLAAAERAEQKETADSQENGSSKESRRVSENRDAEECDCVSKDRDAEECSRASESGSTKEAGCMPENRNEGKSSHAPELVRHFELSQAGAVRRVRAGSFLPPVIVSAAVVILAFLRSGTNGHYTGLLWIIPVFALCTPLFFAAAAWMDRQRTAVISRDSGINVNFARAKKQVWSRYWLFCAWLNTAFTALAALLVPREAGGSWLLWGCLLYTLILTAGSGKMAGKLSRLEERYAPQTDASVMEDDDDNWLWGCVYHNRSDKRVMVEARVGLGTSVNVATPVGRGLTVFSVFVLLMIPILCLWTIMVEFTPLRLEIRGDELVAEQLKTDYRIAVSDITELTLVEELPELSKIAGTGMDNLYKGKWHILYGDNCEVFLNPQNNLFLRFVSDGVLYYMSAPEDEETRALYEKLGGK